MTAKDAVDLLQSGGVLAAAMLAIWALLTGKVVTRREFDRLESQYLESQKDIQSANDELRQSAATNARLVELSFRQNQQAENIRTGPQPINRRASDVQ
jgi:hypothetical protein